MVSALTELLTGIQWWNGFKHCQHYS